MISGGRSKKLPLTGPQQRFAVRHRLLPLLLARAFPPLVVELFAVNVLWFIAGPDHRSEPACRQDGRSPRQRRLRKPRSKDP